MTTVITFESALEDISRVESLLQKYVSPVERSYIVQCNSLPGRGAAVEQLREICSRTGEATSFHVLATEDGPSSARRIIEFCRRHEAEHLCLGIKGDRTPTGEQRVRSIAEEILLADDLDGALRIEEGVVHLRDLEFE